MPKNKKEEIIFTLLMCSLMVLGMSCYNLLLHDQLTLTELAHGYLPGFFTALLLDVFVIGILAKKIAFKLPIKHPIFMALTISSLMVLGMVTCMSLFGLVVEGGLPTPFLPAYARTWRFNFLAALPLQLLLVGPFSRKILKKIQATPA